MTARLKGPENHGGFSHNGTSYAPDADGIIEVPHDAVEAAFSHGFTLLPAAAQPGGDENKSADLSKLNKKDLLALAKDKFGLELEGSPTNKELIAAIEAAQQAAA